MFLRRFINVNFFGIGCGCCLLCVFVGDIVEQVGRLGIEICDVLGYVEEVVVCVV